MAPPRRLGLCGALAFTLLSCAQRATPTPPSAPARIAIVAAERVAGSAVLVALDEHGDRVAWLVRAASEPVHDTNPAVSPDGRWLVFASSRGRAHDGTSLWIA